MTKTIKISSLLLLASLSSYFLLANNDSAKKNKIIYLHEQEATHRSADDLFTSFTKHGNVVMIFYADWCNPCKRSAPIIEAVAQALPQFTFVKVNGDKYKKLYFYYTENHGMKGIPSFLFFKNGKLLKVYSDGKKTVEEWIEYITALYGAGN